MSHRMKQRMPASDVVPLEPLDVLTDEPITSLANDSLGTATLARVIARAAIGSSTPLTIGLFGDWGQGKTSILRMSKQLLDSAGQPPPSPLTRPAPITVWFNAWQYERESLPIVPLVLAIQREVLRRVADDPTFLQSVGQQGKARLQRFVGSAIEFVKGINVSAGLSAPTPGVGTCDLTCSLDGTAIASALAQLFGSTNNSAVSDSISRFANTSLAMTAFESLESLTTRVAAAHADDGTAARIVVFLDDVDRCESPAAMRLLEHIKLVLSHPGIVFVIALNRDELEAYERHRMRAASASGSWERSRFMDKMIQLPLYVPNHSQAFGPYVRKTMERVSGPRGLSKGTTDAIRAVGDDLAQLTSYSPRMLIRQLNALLVDLAMEEQMSIRTRRRRDRMPRDAFVRVCLTQRMFQDTLRDDITRSLSADHDLCVLLAENGLDGAHDIVSKQAMAARDLVTTGGTRTLRLQEGILKGRQAICSQLLASRRCTYCIDAGVAREWLGHKEWREYATNLIASWSHSAKGGRGSEFENAQASGGDMGTDKRMALPVEIATIERAARRCLGIEQSVALTPIHWMTVTELALANSPVSDDGIRWLLDTEHDLSGLLRLILWGTRVTDLTLMRLAEGDVRVPNLESLDVDGTRISDVGIRHLARNEGVLRHIRDLFLANTNVTDVAATLLADGDGRLPRLQRLYLGGNAIGDTAVSRLLGSDSRVGKLSVIDLRRTQITGATGAVLRSASTGEGGLQEVYVGSNRQLGDVFCQALTDGESGTSSLRVLGVADIAMSDDGLIALASQSNNMGELAELYLGGNGKITDKGAASLLSPVKRFGRLGRLDLSGSRVSDETLERLIATDSALPRLEWLDVRRTTVTDQAVRRLRKARLGARLHVECDPSSLAPSGKERR